MNNDIIFLAAVGFGLIWTAFCYALYLIYDKLTTKKE